MNHTLQVGSEGEDGSGSDTADEGSAPSHSSHGSEPRQQESPVKAEPAQEGNLVLEEQVLEPQSGSSQVDSLAPMAKRPRRSVALYDGTPQAKKSEVVEEIKKKQVKPEVEKRGRGRPKGSFSKDRRRQSSSSERPEPRKKRSSVAMRRRSVSSSSSSDEEQKIDLKIKELRVQKLTAEIENQKLIKAESDERIKFYRRNTEDFATLINGVQSLIAAVQAQACAAHCPVPATTDVAVAPADSDPSQLKAFNGEAVKTVNGDTVEDIRNAEPQVDVVNGSQD